MPVQILRLTAELYAVELGNLQLQMFDLKSTNAQALLEGSDRLTQLLFDSYCIQRTMLHGPRKCLLMLILPFFRLCIDLQGNKVMSRIRNMTAPVHPRSVQQFQV
ncbi:hypothetical protein ASG35_11555 [Burkholderia sp. Leaf177]|nr:hypothetical protein ASG35_11555 [Burkholderia sp. Leaf177]